MRQIRDHLVTLMQEERVQFDRMLKLTIALAGRGLAGDHGPEVLVDGTASLLSKPEIADLAGMRRMLEAFGDKARLVQLLNRWLHDRQGNAGLHR